MIKKFLILLTLLPMIILCVSCATLPGKFDSLAQKAEQKGEGYSQEEWTKSNQEFEALVDEFIANYDSYTTQEKKEISTAIGKYTAAAVRSGMSEISTQVQEIANQLPSIINDLLETAKGFLEGLKL